MGLFEIPSLPVIGNRRLRVLNIKLMRTYNRLTDTQAREYMLSRPDSNFVAFTHMNKSWPAPDFLIRKYVSMVPRYKNNGVTTDNTFSHTGTIWVENGELTYYHQTWPVFKKEKWNFRRYNIILEVTDSQIVSKARHKCEEMYYKKRGYGIGQLLAFAFTIWFTWFSNPITAGKVCSEAVAVSYPDYILKKGISAYDVDPQYAFDRLKEQGLLRLKVDRR